MDVSKLFCLAGKTAIVTGGTGGLGTAMTTALASAGADIVSIELPDDPGSEKTKDIVRGLGRQYTKYECDMRDMKNVRSTYQRMWSEGVRADIVLVSPRCTKRDQFKRPICKPSLPKLNHYSLIQNCAGVQRRAEATDFTDEDIDLVIDINLKAVLVSCQEFAKKLLADGQPGKIINIASINSFTGGKNITPYAGSKGGVLQITKAMSNEWAEKGIQCNCIHPGYMRTPMTEQYMTDPKYATFNDYVCHVVGTLEISSGCLFF